MSKCIGCGVELQSTNKEKLGYVNSLDNNLCERCFKIRNYNEYRFVIKDNNEYINILNKISKTNDLVVLVVDLFNISSNLDSISNYINNDVLLVLSKRDILPKSCPDIKFLDYFNNLNLNIIDRLVISSKKNYNLDELYNKINKYKKSNLVYIVGYTNSGKSTLINKIIYNYSNLNNEITTSNLPSTTIDSIYIKVNDSLTLVDTPGLLDLGDISNNVDEKVLKQIIPVKEIKPITYQVKCKQSIIINNLVRIDLLDNTNITIYMSNSLNIKRVFRSDNYLKDLKEYDLSVLKNQDLVIEGLGFINFSNHCNIKVYVDKAHISLRKELI